MSNLISALSVCFGVDWMLVWEWRLKAAELLAGGQVVGELFSRQFKTMQMEMLKTTLDKTWNLFGVSVETKTWKKRYNSTTDATIKIILFDIIYINFEYFTVFIYRTRQNSALVWQYILNHVSYNHSWRMFPYIRKIILCVKV